MQACYVLLVSLAMISSSVGLAACEVGSCGYEPHMDSDMSTSGFGSDSAGSSSSVCHQPWRVALVVAAAIGVALAAMQELYEGYLLGVRQFFSSPWNWIDLLSASASAIGLVGCAMESCWLIRNVSTRQPTLFFSST